MSSSVRKSRSPWDMKDVLSPEHGESNAMTGKKMYSGFHGHSSKSCDLDGNNATNSPSWELLGNNGLNKDDYINKNGYKISDSTYGGDNCYGKSLCLASDEWNQQTNKSDNKQSQSHRDRSRSRGKVCSQRDGRGRSQSRGRNRSRSRSRSRKMGKPRFWSNSWSRSPLRDQMHRTYGWNDRRSSSGISFHPCREFALGKCRRGSQCRFLHEDNLNYRDMGCANSSSERWRCGPEYGVTLKDGDNKGHSRDRSRGNSFDGYGNGELLKNNHKAEICCKDFLKGKCRWGSSCRFSHNAASNDNYESGDRNVSFNHDSQHRTNKISKVPCKYFVMGKCHLDDCRFSHDDPASGNPVFRYRSAHSLDQKSRSWNGSTWDNATGFLSITRSRGLVEGFTEDMNFVDPLAVEKWAGGGWDHASEEIRTLGRSAWLNGAPERDVNRESGNSGADMGITDSVGKLVVREDPKLGLRGSQSQVPDSYVHEATGTQEAWGHQLATAVLQPKLSESYFYRQSPGGPGQGRDVALTDGCNALTDKLSRNVIHPVLVPGQSFDQTADSMGSKPLILSLNLSNGQNGFNGMVQHECYPSILQKQMDFHLESAVKHQVVEPKVPTVTSEVSQNVVTSEKVAQIANLLEAVAQRFGNGQWLPQSDAVLDPLNSMVPVASHLKSASLVPHINTTTVEPAPATGSQEQYDPIGGIIEPSKAGNSYQSLGHSSSLSGQKNEIPTEHLSIPSSVNYGSSKFHQDDSSKEEYTASPMLEQKKAVTGVEANQNNQIVAEEGKREQANINSENLDAEGGVDEGGLSKDEKGMHLFRMALIELVKEILRPTWKEGKMSREVHKTIVKKVDGKVTSTIQGDHVPKTQEKVNQYLSFSKPKITKLVQAYVEKFLRS